MMKTIKSGIVVLAVYAAWACWQFVTPHVTEIAEPMSHREFLEKFAGPEASHSQVRHLMLPPTASNILYASSSVGMGGRGLCYRFSAPISNMLQHISFLNDIPTRKREENEPLPYEPVKAPVSRAMMKPYGLHQLDWFDVENISTGFVSGAAGYNSTIWIDAERELYYYYWTD